jgi:hypothetical protein
VVDEQMSHAKVHAEVDYEEHKSPTHLHASKSKRLTVEDAAEESRELQRMEHLALDRVSSIQFCVDGAVGMPASVTATRVTARLLDHDRRQIGEPSASTVSQPDSPVSAPIFDLNAGWRGERGNVCSTSLFWF